LTAQERYEIQKHPIYALEMLKGIDFLRDALDIPYAHHEKWDGSGYPRGLKGEQIPLAARIFAVVDVWDALTSNRPYRKAWTREMALRYLANGAGKQFDPRIVRLFLKIETKSSLDAAVPVTTEMQGHLHDKAQADQSFADQLGSIDRAQRILIAREKV
jgi:HD-GYP domain-containing protein (c-di-GMP phosphodiesterase class II)